MPANPVFQQQEVYSLDGVYYASFFRNGELWRLGSSNPNWPEELAFIGSNPDKLALNMAEERAFWLKKAENPPRIAIMCCGLGAAWPGMGRELYDKFPACREAMDQLAKIADWDLLSIMDEKDLETINQTRIQIPYLFMLEYAQWKQFLSLGIKPSIMSGHSLGELVALCLAGVYSPETAWHILDTRSEHIARMEAKLAKQGGMLAIAGDFAPASGIMDTYPAVRIANKNASRQFILSGPREDLMAIRKILRRNHIPAIMLNMSLSFHHPSMRVLRDLAIRRLNALAIKKADIPMLSCVRNELYPENQKEICNWIADLDENTVDWMGSLDVMQKNFHINCWLELGPQEILAGLVNENIPGSIVISASRKGKECEAMRQACARLYSLGLLDSLKIRKFSHQRFAKSKNSEFIKKPEDKSEAITDSSKISISPEAKIILESLAEISPKKIENIHPELDLRHDLSIRSSRFPYLLQEIEKKLGKKIQTELLFNVATVGDILSLFCNGQEQIQKFAKNKKTLVRLPHFFRSGRLAAFRPGEQGPLPICWQKGNRKLDSGKIIIIAVFSRNMLESICLELAAASSKFAVPSFLIDESSYLDDKGMQIIPFNPDSEPCPDKWKTAFTDLLKNYGEAAGLIFMPPVSLNNSFSKNSEQWQQLPVLAEKIFSPANDNFWICSIERIFNENDINAFQTESDIFSQSDKNLQIFWLENPDLPESEKGELAAESLNRDLHGKLAGKIVWKTISDDGNNPLKLWLPVTDSLLPIVEASEKDWRAYRAKSQFSLYALPELADYGIISRQDSDLPEIFADSPYLSPGNTLKAMLDVSTGIFPWLHPVGISDIHFYQILPLPHGITRECNLEVFAQPWIESEKISTKMLKVEISFRKLAENGRPLDEYSVLANAVPLLTAQTTEISPIWRNMPQAESKILKKTIKFDQDPGIKNNYFNLNEIRKIYFSSDIRNNMPEYSFFGDFHSFIADNVNWRYKYLLQLVDCAVSGVNSIIFMDEATFPPAKFPINHEEWQLETIGYVRFASYPSLRQENKPIFLAKCSWKDASIIRFDIQAASSSWQTLMTMHHVEFTRNKKFENADKQENLFL